MVWRRHSWFLADELTLHLSLSLLKVALSVNCNPSEVDISFLRRTFIRQPYRSAIFGGTCGGGLCVGVTNVSKFLDTLKLFFQIYALCIHET